MFPVNDLFTAEDKKNIFTFLDTWPRYLEILNYRKIASQHVKTVFFGDSITNAFPLNEFFPNASLLNRGIGGDNVNGLYFRLEDDVLPYHPEQVVMMIGINGIQWDFDLIVRKIAAVAALMKERGIKVWLCSITPLRYPDKWDRFQYQGKIEKLNGRLREMAEKDFDGFVDYHSALKDEKGELAVAYARDDGTHITFAGYQVMAKVLSETIAL